MKKTITYKCDYCKEEGHDRQSLLAHENGCSWNPKSRGCYTCAYLKMDSFRFNSTNEVHNVFFGACLLNLPIDPLSNDLNENCNKYENEMIYIKPKEMKSILNGYDFKGQLNKAFKQFELKIKEEEQEKKQEELTSPFGGEEGPDELPF